jgi:carbamate kinase
MKIVIALGGNAITHNSEAIYSDMFKAIQKTAEIISDLTRHGHKITIVHGSGPQVGSILIQNEAFPKTEMPLDVCGAESQAQIGYMLQQAIQNETKKKVCTIVTRVLVDHEDSAFSNPEKPIGPFYSKQQSLKFKGKYRLKLIEGKGYRRVVPSPDAKEIVELKQIEKLTEDSIVICCGGGGIPVIKEKGKLKGVRAVIDKDNTAALLAKDLKADLLLILTDVDSVYINYNNPDQKKLKEVSISKARALLAEGQFPAGSMGPKVQAAIKFNKETIITSIDKAEYALQGKAGTVIK